MTVVFQFLEDVFNASLGYLNNPEKRIFWVYILSSLLLGFYVYKKRKRTSETFFSYFFRKENYLSKSAITDYSFLILNGFVKVLLIGILAYWGREQQNNLNEFLLENFGYKTFNFNLSTLLILYPIAFLLVSDFSYYLLHLLYHKVPFLWAFHKIHHSSTAMNPLTQYRIHPVELIINNVRVILVIVFVNGVFNYLNGGYFNQATILGVNIILLAFNSWGANLRHSHIKLSYFNWLENWLISPYQHQIHHSCQKHLYDKNLGSKLAIWDKIFGTLVKSKDVIDLEVGLGEENSNYNNFWKNLYQPFISVFKR